MKRTLTEQQKKTLSVLAIVIFVLLSAALARRCSAAGIDRAPRKRERPSDHAPVWAQID